MLIPFYQKQTNKNNSDILDSVDKKSLAWKMLQYIVYFAPKNMEFIALREIFYPTSKNNLILEISSLKQLGLIDEVHNCLQHTIKISEKTQRKVTSYIEERNVDNIVSEDEIITDLLRAYDNFAPEVNYYPNDDWSRSINITPHVEKLLDIVNIDQSNPQICSLLYKLSLHHLEISHDRLKREKYITLFHEVTQKLYPENNHELSAKSYLFLSSINSSFYEKNGFSDKKSLELVDKVFELSENLNFTNEYDKIEIQLKAYSQRISALVNHQSRKEITLAATYAQERLKLAHKLGPESEQVVTSLVILTEVYKLLENKGAALSYYNQAIKTVEKLYPSKYHPLVAYVYFKANIILPLEKALIYCKESLEIRKIIYPGQDHFNIAHNLSLCGDLYFKMNTKSSFEKALEYYEESLKILDKKYDYDIPQKSYVLFSQSMVYCKLGKEQLALNNLDRYMNIIKNIYLEDSKLFAGSLLNIARIYQSLNKKEYALKALEYSKHGLEIYKAHDVETINKEYVSKISCFYNSIEKSLYTLKRYEQNIEKGVAIKKQLLYEIIDFRFDFFKVFSKAEYSNQLEYNYEKAQCLMSISYIYNCLGMQPLDKKSLNCAKLYFENAYNIFDKLTNFEDKQDKLDQIDKSILHINRLLNSNNFSNNSEAMLSGENDEEMSDSFV